MLKSDQIQVESFLKDFVENVVELFGDKIDFILLFGSVSRGEFVRGRSDVDLIIQVKDNSFVEPVYIFAEKIFWKLDEKYFLDLKKVCSTGKANDLIEELLKPLEKQARLYKPFEVFGPNDLDWENGWIVRKDLQPGAFLIASQLTLFYKMKIEGKILYGRNILNEINPRFSFWEKFKAILIPQHLAFFGLILSVFFPKKAVGYAVKAVFYEIDSSLIFLEKLSKSREKNLKEFEMLSEIDLKQFLNLLRFSWDLKLSIYGKERKEILFSAIDFKKNGFNGSRFEAFFFCLSALKLIVSTNWIVSFKRMQKFVEKSN